MAAILRVRDENGNIVDIPAIVGPRGLKGDIGEPAKINGVNALTIEVDDNMTITQDGSVLRIGVGNISKSTIVTLLASGWAEQSNGRYAQTVSVPFMTADVPVVRCDVYLSGEDADADDTMEEAFLANVYRAVQNNGSVTVWSRKVPSVDIQISVGLVGGSA